MDLIPLSPPLISGNAIVTRDRMSKTTGIDGTVTFTNLVGGTNVLYRAEFHGTWGVTTNWYQFPETNLLLNATDWGIIPTNQTSGYAYTTAAADAKFATLSQLAASSNAVTANAIARSSGAGTNTTLYDDTGAKVIDANGFYDAGNFRFYDRVQKKSFWSDGVGNTAIDWATGSLDDQGGNAAIDLFNRQAKDEDNNVLLNWSSIGALASSIAASGIATTNQVAAKLTATGGLGTSNTLQSPILTGAPYGQILQLASTNWVAGRGINVVFEGDSITAGGYFAGVNSWPYFFTNLPFWSSAIVSSHNSAVGGAVLDGTYCSNGGNTVTNRMATDMGYKSNNLNNVFFLFIGANDYIGPAGCGSVAPDPVYWTGLLDRQLGVAKSNGFVTVAFTVMPRSQGADGWDNVQTYNAPKVRDVMNQRIRIGLTNADFIVDTGAFLADMRTNLAYGNIPLSVDGIHPNNVGSKQIANLADMTLRLNMVPMMPPSPLANVLSLGVVTTNMTLAIGSAGVVITNFGGNQLCILQPASGSPENFIINSLGTQSKVLRNSGNYGGTGNTWYDATTGGSSSAWEWGYYNGGWIKANTLSNNGDYRFHQGVAMALKGLSSYATNTVTITSTGYTNSTSVSIRVIGLTGTSITQSNSISGVSFSRGTLSSGVDIVLQPGESITGSSVAAQTARAF